MISILTDPAVGGTFLTWTIHYLSGHKQYYHYELGWCNLPDNPLTELNSHGFNPNQIHDLNLGLLISKLLNVDSEYQIVYFHNVHPSDSVINKLVMENLGEHVILLTVPKSHHHYQTKFTGRSLIKKVGSLGALGEENISWEEQHQDFLNYFFSEAQQKWNLSDTKEVWVHREFLALNFRPYELVKITELFDNHQPHLYLDARDVWTSLDFVINDIFCYIDRRIDQSRWDSWVKIYHQWRTKHYDRIRFGWYFDEILNKILSGQDMSLERFNLDIVREAAIQHVLIFQYGLNLKTFGVDKFVNTRQLHELLEPNIYHDIGEYNYDIINQRFPRS
jgi:hypothetical protein